MIFHGRKSVSIKKRIHLRGRLFNSPDFLLWTLIPNVIGPHALSASTRTKMAQMAQAIAAPASNI
jgi:hypothetical protein